MPLTRAWPTNLAGRARQSQRSGLVSTLRFRRRPRRRDVPAVNGMAERGRRATIGRVAQTASAGARRGERARMARMSRQDRQFAAGRCRRPHTGPAIRPREQGGLRCQVFVRRGCVRAAACHRAWGTAHGAWGMGHASRARSGSVYIRAHSSGRRSPSAARAGWRTLAGPRLSHCWRRPQPTTSPCARPEPGREALAT